MRTITLLSLLFCLVAGISFGAHDSGQRVLVSGDPGLTRPLTEFIRRIDDSAKSPQALADSAVSWLAVRGYLDASAQPKGDTIVVSTGSIVLLSRLDVVSDTARSIIITKPFTPENLKAGLEMLVQTYRDEGYYFCRAQVANVRRQRNEVTVSATVSPGPVVKIKQLEYRGLSRTRPHQIARYLTYDSGGTLTDNAIHRLESQAAAVPFVDFLPPAVIRPLAGFGDAVVDLHFTERQQVLFEGGAGYDPELKSGLVWNLNVHLQNLFGDGKGISIQSARQDKGRNLLDLKYRQPLFVLGTGSFHAQIYTRDYRDQFYEFSVLTGIDLNLAPQQVLGGELTWKRVDPDTGSSYRRYAADFAYSLDQRDRPVDASRGFRFSSRLGYAFRTYLADSVSSKGSFNDTRAQFEGEYYRRMVGSLLLFSAVSYRGVESKERPMPVSELYFVGGPGTLRGYRNEQFIAQRVAVGTAELRFRFPGGYLFGFYDGAYLNSPVVAGNMTVISEAYRFGFGGGLSIADRSRAVTVSLGWNPDLALDQPQLSIQFSSGL